MSDPTTTYLRVPITPSQRAQLRALKIRGMGEATMLRLAILHAIKVGSAGLDLLAPARPEEADTRDVVVSLPRSVREELRVLERGTGLRVRMLLRAAVATYLREAESAATVAAP